MALGQQPIPITYVPIDVKPKGRGGGVRAFEDNLKSHVFNLDLKEERESQALSLRGRVFQTEGAAIVK